MLYNFSGFETGDGAESPIGDSAAVVMAPSPVRTGQFSCKVNPVGSARGHITLRTPALNGVLADFSLTELYLRFYINVELFPASGSEEIATISISGGQNSTLRINSTGALEFYSGSTTLLGTGVALSTDTWYRVEVRCQSGAGKDWEVRVDGVSYLSGTDDFSASNMTRILLGKNINHSSQDIVVYYDDIAFGDAWIGAGECRRLNVTGDGIYTAWTGTSADVDDLDGSGAHDGDTTFISTTTFNDKESCTMQSAAAAGITGTINAVKATVIARDEDGTAAWAVGIRSNNIDRIAGTSDGDTTYRARCKIEGPNNSGTASNWTLSDLDTVEPVIHQFQVAASVAVRCTAMTVTVDFVPAVVSDLQMSSTLAALTLESELEVSGGGGGEAERDFTFPPSQRFLGSPF